MLHHTHNAFKGAESMETNLAPPPLQPEDVDQPDVIDIIVCRTYVYCVNFFRYRVANNDYCLVGWLHAKEPNSLIATFVTFVSFSVKQFDRD